MQWTMNPMQKNKTKKNWNWLVKRCGNYIFFLHFMHLADAFIQSDLVHSGYTFFCHYAEFGLHDLLHAIVMRISSVKTVLWLAVNLHQLFFQMERYLIHRAEVHWQATQFALRIADESHAIVNVRLRSLSATYRAVLEGILFIRSQHYCKLSNLTDKKRSAELDL